MVFTGSEEPTCCAKSGHWIERSGRSALCIHLITDQMVLGRLLAVTGLAVEAQW